MREKTNLPVSEHTIGESHMDTETSCYRHWGNWLLHFSAGFSNQFGVDKLTVGLMDLEAHRAAMKIVHLCVIGIRDVPEIIA